MPSYKRVVVYIFLAVLLSACSNIIPQEPAMQENLIKRNFKYKPFAHEDKYIMFALEFDRHGQKNEARQLFKKLYYETNKEEYLEEYIKLSFTLKKHDDVISIVEYNRKKIVREKSRIIKIYVLSLMQKNQFDKAESTILELLKEEKTDLNYELLGNIYIQKNEYKKAKNVFSKIYEKSGTSNSLLNLTNIMYVYLDEKDEAINLLEAYTKINGCNNLICSKLLSFYQEQKDIDGVITVLKKTYYGFQEKGSEFSLQKVYKLLMYYLEKKDIHEAIAFLEKSKADDEKLLNLYRNSQQYDKAYSLAKTLYEKSSNIDYLAQIAIIEFEGAKDKKTVLDNVIKKFEDVLTVLDNHVYQNYLGYILIDFDIDIKRGLEFVNKALEKAPNNLAYIDSLAWGQYKLNDCKNAYINMKKVVDSAGLNDIEIKTHWEKIKECNK